MNDNLTDSLTDTIEMAKSISKCTLEKFEVDILTTSLIGSFSKKGYTAKDIDILVTVKDIKKLEKTKIISQSIDGMLLDIFVIDTKGKKGVYEDMGFYSKFKRLKS